MPGKNTQVLAAVNVSGRYPKWPVFKLSMNGRFWVSTEGMCSGVSVGASSSMSDRTPTGQDGTTYTEFYVAGVPQ